MNPAISVIIPTAGLRPILLIRAVESALVGFASGEVEIVVVPNGSELRWHDAIAGIANYPNVNIFPVDKASANAARNHGLANAQGVLVRFVDDDDYLIPEVASRQCYELFASGADASSYAIRIEDEWGKVYQTMQQPKTNDFVAGQLGPFCLGLPLAHLYRRELILSVLWNERYLVCEDNAWLHSVACQKDVKWLKSEDIVGVWYQHRGPRLSYACPAHEPSYITAESILNTVAILEQQGRLNDERKIAAAEGLWLCVHRGFYFNPLHWHSVAKKLPKLGPNLYPQTFLFTLPGFASLNPLLMEWLLLPARWLIFCAKWLQALVFGWNPVRRL